MSKKVLVAICDRARDIKIIKNKCDKISKENDYIFDVEYVLTIDDYYNKIHGKFYDHIIIYNSINVNHELNILLEKTVDEEYKEYDFISTPIEYCKGE